MSSPASLTERSVSPSPESSTPARFNERLTPGITPAQVHAVLRDIIRRDPDLWRRVQRDRALWQAFGFDTETEDVEPPTAAASAG